MSHAGSVSSTSTDASTTGQHAGTSLSPAVLSANCCVLCCLVRAEALLELDNSFGSYTSTLNDQDNSAVDHIKLDSPLWQGCLA